MRIISLFIIVFCIIKSDYAYSQTERQKESQLIELPDLNTNSRNYINVVHSNNLDSLINEFVHYGVSVSDVSFTGAPISNGIGYINIGLMNNGNAANLGINNGLILGTGSIQNHYINQPASSLSSLSLTLPGFPLLNSIAGNSSYDAAVLKFKIVPIGNIIEFKYIFASEEYHNYVNSSYNDVFGFFISGPNPMGGNYLNKNIALLPGSELPVAINNVNNGLTGAYCSTGPCFNCEYFVDNCDSPIFIFDGRTTLLSAQAYVISGAEYELTIAVADIGDRIYDSAVILECPSLLSYFTTDIVSVNTNETKVYPNPINNESRIILSNFINEHINITVYDISSRIVNKVSLFNQTNEILANELLNGLMPGAYIIRLETKHTNNTIKVLIE